MRGSVGEFLIERLASYGVDTCFGIPGDFTLKWYNQLNKSKIKVIGMTDELSAGYAADCYARVKGIGCVCVTYCVGGFSVQNAIACAYAERSPVVLISGSPGIKEREEGMLIHHMVRSYECQHEVFEHITCANTVLRDPERAGYEIDRVLNACMEYKQPVYIELPRDIVDKPLKYDPYSLGNPKEYKSDSENLQESVEEVVNWINNAKKPIIWAGVEVARFGFAKNLLKFAEKTNIPVATTILGKSVINEKHPLSLGVYCASTSSEELVDYMEESDCIIMLGVMMTDMNMGFLPLKYQKRNVALVTTKELQVRNHTYNKVKFADFCESLFKANIIKREVPVVPKKEKISVVFSEPKKITIERFFQRIDSLLTPTMSVVADVGDSLFGALDLNVHDSANFISPAFYTTMGFAVPGSVGLQFAKPGTRPLVIVGDGAFQMTGKEFSTLVKVKSNAIVFVLNNGGYGTERIMLDGSFNDIPVWEYDRIPCLVGGGLGHKVRTEMELEDAIKKALTSNVPNIINVLLDKDDHSPALVRMFTKLAKKC